MGCGRMGGTALPKKMNENDEGERQNKRETGRETETAHDIIPIIIIVLYK